LVAPDAFAGNFENFDFGAREDIVRVIKAAFATPGGLDLRAMVADMRAATSGAAYRLERIARSETTRIVNESRAEQWRKYVEVDRPIFEWSIADDERVDAQCKIIAE